ncbi:MAG: chromosome partitioning protein ParB, partial [Alphaproteobacteria bacterium HGW-Alphaproteobacteria-12]
VMGETLQVGSAAVEALAVVLKRDMGPVWEPDETFFELLRDRGTINAMLADIAGKSVADQNVAEKASVQKQIIRDCLAGANGRAKVGTWLPRWMHVPARSYREDGAFPPAEAWDRVAGYFGKT